MRRFLDTYNEERLPNAKRLTRPLTVCSILLRAKTGLLVLIRTTIFPPLAKYILSIDAVRKKFFHPHFSDWNYLPQRLTEHA